MKKIAIVALAFVLQAMGPVAAFDNNTERLLYDACLADMSGQEGGTPEEDETLCRCTSKELVESSNVTDEMRMKFIGGWNLKEKMHGGSELSAEDQELAMVAFQIWGKCMNIDIKQTQ